MTLDELKKASEIFNNFAQPIATVATAYIGSRLIRRNKQKSNKRRKKRK